MPEAFYHDVMMAISAFNFDHLMDEGHRMMMWLNVGSWMRMPSYYSAQETHFLVPAVGVAKLARPLLTIDRVFTQARSDRWGIPRMVDEIVRVVMWAAVQEPVHW